MSCLCKPSCTTTPTACTCSGCSGADCSEDFKKTLKGVDCNAAVVTNCPTKEQVVINWKIVAQLQAAMCLLKDYDLHKETTWKVEPTPKITTVNPSGAPTDPCIGDIHIVRYLEVPGTDDVAAVYSFGGYSFNGVDWTDWLGDQVCLSDSTILALKPDRFFIDNVINLDRIDTGFSFIGVDYKDMQVTWNDGHEIFHRDEQVYTGVVVYDFNTVDGNIFFLHGPKGDGAYLTPVFLGTADDPAYFKVVVNKYGSSSSVLSCS